MLQRLPSIIGRSWPSALAALLLVAAATPIGSCASSTPRAASPAPSAVASVAVTAPPEVALEIACTPSGPETCFDAMDNNCNGAIDEGCGVHTGVVQFAIAWSDESADVELDVVDPKGEAARVNDVTQLGLAKDRACPAASESCHGQNTENVYLVEGDVPRGKYRVLIRLAKMGHEPAPTRVRFTARVGQRTWSAVLEFRVAREQKVLTFEL